MNAFGTRALAFRGEVLRTRRRGAARAALILGVGIVVTQAVVNHGRVSDVRHRLVIAQAPIDWDSYTARGIAFDTPESRRAVIQSRETEVPILQEAVQELPVGLASTRLHEVVFGALGSVAGVSLAILLATTLFAAEFRWRHWGTLAIHMPSRRELMTTKLLALWALLGIGLLILYGVALIANAAGSVAVDHPVGLPPPPHRVIPSFAAAWLSVGTFATIAAAAVMVTGTTLAGVLLPGGMLIADGVVTQHAIELRHVLPAQSVGWLLAEPLEAGYRLVGTLWWLRVEPPWIVNGIEIPRSPLPGWEATLILAAWGLVAALAAIAWFRRRDVLA